MKTPVCSTGGKGPVGSIDTKECLSAVIIVSVAKPCILYLCLSRTCCGVMGLLNDGWLSKTIEL